MSLNRLSLSLALVFVLALAQGSSWARDEQGINDYAKAHWDPHKSCVPFVRKYESVCGGNFKDDPTGRNANNYDSRASTSTCSNLPPDQQPTVLPGDIISVYLTQAHISDFTERWGALFGSKRGEIAIVARAAELDAGSDFDFASTGKDRGRLVYYSEGVQPRQFLNFSQIPIYGPVEYTGKPLVLELYLLELDVTENTEVSGMLSAAAGLGATAYPPASPVLRVLDTIGGGLLRGNSSDLEFKYHAALLASERQMLSLKAGTLEYGNYVFVRMPYTNPDAREASNSHRWNSWYFNQKTGRLYDRRSDCSEPLLSQTYVSLQINRAKEATTLDLSNTLAAFTARLTTQAKASSLESIKVIDALKQSVTSEKKYKDAKDLIDHANRIRWATPERGPDRLDAATKSALTQLVKDIDNSLRIARNQGGTTPAQFDETRASFLVEALSRLVGGAKKISPHAFAPADVMTDLP